LAFDKVRQSEIGKSEINLKSEICNLKSL